MPQIKASEILLSLPLFITELKSLPIHFTFIQEQDNTWSGRTIEFQTIENANSLDELKLALVDGMQEWANTIRECYEQWVVGRENQVPYLVKVLISTREELLSCLHGSNSGNI